jgi:nitroreductase
MNVYEAIKGRRTIRKFRQQRIGRDTLEKLIDAARYAPSASNLQPLKYRIVDEPGEVGQVFAKVRWAGTIAPAGDPAPGERPVAFLVILVDTAIRSSGYELDLGAAAQNMFLAAAEEGIGTCWMGAIDADGIRAALDIPERYRIDTVVALGRPAESPVAEDESGSIRYYKDASGVLHVPKRKLRDIIL